MWFAGLRNDLNEVRATLLDALPRPLRGCLTVDRYDHRKLLPFAHGRILWGNSKDPPFGGPGRWGVVWLGELAGEQIQVHEQFHRDPTSVDDGAVTGEVAWDDG